MGAKVIPSDCAHRDSHPSFYKGNYWDYYLSLLPLLMPLLFFTVPNAYSRRDPILNSKVL